MKNTELIKKNQELRNEIRRLKQRYKDLENYSKDMERKIHNLRKHKKILLESDLQKTDEAREKFLKQKDMKKKDFMIEQVEHEIKNQKHLIGTFENKFKHINELKEIKSENRLPVVLIDNFKLQDINKAHKEFRLSDQIVYFKYPNQSKTALKRLISLRPRFVCGNLSEHMINGLESKGIEYLETEITFHDLYGSVSFENFRKSQKKGLLSIIKGTKPLY